MKSLKLKTLLVVAFISSLGALTGCKDDEPTAKDTQSPTLLSFQPSDGEDNVSVNTIITATFSEELDEATVTTSSFSLKKGVNSVSGSISIVGKTVTFTPSVELEYETSYKLSISTSLSDLAGNKLSEEVSFSFTTEVEPDLIKPTVLSSEPASGAKDVALDASFEINFSEAINESTLKIRFTFPGGFSESATVEVSGTKATITPENNLKKDTDYELVVFSSVEDLAGNRMSSNFNLEFTTELPGIDLPTEFLGSWLDVNGNVVYFVGKDAGEDFISFEGIRYFFDRSNVTIPSSNTYNIEAKSNGGTSKTFRLQLTGSKFKIRASTSGGALRLVASVVGRTISYAKATTGHQFSEISPGNWREQTPDGKVFSFTETRRDDWSVFLEKSDGAQLRIDSFKEKIFINGSELYDISDMSN